MLFRLNKELEVQYKKSGMDFSFQKNEIECKSKLILADIPADMQITRKQAAIISHEYLLKILDEEDEKDISKALILKDLYDCRVCVKHIAQVYIKGIIKPQISEGDAKNHSLPVIFGGNEVVAETEIEAIIERIFNKDKRSNK